MEVLAATMIAYLLEVCLQIEHCVIFILLAMRRPRNARVLPRPGKISPSHHGLNAPENADWQPTIDIP